MKFLHFFSFTLSALWTAPCLGFRKSPAAGKNQPDDKPPEGPL